MIKCLILLLKWKNQSKSNKNKETLKNFSQTRKNKLTLKIWFSNFWVLLKEIYLMMKNLLTHCKIRRKKLNKFQKKCKNSNISVLNLMVSETSINKYQREYPTFISSLWISPTLSQLINGHYSSTLTYLKELSRNRFLEKKIDARISSTNSKYFSMNPCVEVC